MKHVSNTLTPLRIAALGLAMLLGPAAHGQQAPMKNDCKAPVVEQKKLDPAGANKLQSEINDYKACVQRYADAEQAEAERHRQAANAAIAEFNDFVTNKIPKPPAD